MIPPRSPLIDKRKREQLLSLVNARIQPKNLAQSRSKHHSKPSAKFVDPLLLPTLSSESTANSHLQHRPLSPVRDASSLIYTGA